MNSPAFTAPDVPSVVERIHVVRGRRVILDAELASLYGVSTKRFNEQVRRNIARFPADFAFRLSNQEVASLRSQNATSNGGRGGRRYAPFAFTEYGAIMAATILNSKRATEVSVYVVRAFVALRQTLSVRKELSQRLIELEERIDGKLAKHDQAIVDILAAIKALMRPPERKSRSIGFILPP